MALAAIMAGANTIGNVAGQLLQNRANKKLAEYSYQKDLEMWQRGNEYNSPQAQMSRLKAAGLNPNLVYGNSTVVGNTSGQLPKYQAPRVEAPKDLGANFMGVLAQYENIKQQGAQTDLVKQNLINAQLEEDKKRKEIAYLDQYLSGRNEKLFYDTNRSALSQLKDQLMLDTKTDVPGYKFFSEGGEYLKQQQATTKLRENQAELQRLEIELMQKGLTKNDSVIARMLLQSGLFDKFVNFINGKLGSKLFK